MDYEEMLKKARKEMPDSFLVKERFEIPKVKGHIQGNRTVIKNFSQIAGTLRRPLEHMQKFILKELAAPADYRNNLLTIKTKIPAARINDKIRMYADEYVICSECGKPDTTVIKENNISFLKCTACGAKHSIRSRI